MPRSVPPDVATAEARLSALGLGRDAWVPEQTHPTVAEGTLLAVPPATGTEPARWPGWARDVRLAATPRALAALAGLCLAIVVVTAVVLAHPHRAPSPVPTSTLEGLPPPARPSPQPIVIDVGGRVRHPGLVTLPAGSRVADALRAAGGALRQRDLLRIDLAARVVDGQLLLVGVVGASGAVSGVTGPSIVDLNAATRDQLEALPGVGTVLAQHILDWRDQHGGFHAVDELNDVPGIGDRIFATLKTLVTV